MQWQIWLAKKADQILGLSPNQEPADEKPGLHTSEKSPSPAEKSQSFDDIADLIGVGTGGSKTLIDLPPMALDLAAVKVTVEWELEMERQGKRNLVTVYPNQVTIGTFELSQNELTTAAVVSEYTSKDGNYHGISSAEYGLDWSLAAIQASVGSQSISEFQGANNTYVMENTARVKYDIRPPVIPIIPVVIAIPGLLPALKEASKWVPGGVTP